MEDQLYWLSAIACSSLSLGANKLFNNILLTLLFKKKLFYGNIIRHISSFSRNLIFPPFVRPLYHRTTDY